MSEPKGGLAPLGPSAKGVWLKAQVTQSQVEERHTDEDRTIHLFGFGQPKTNPEPDPPVCYNLDPLTQEPSPPRQ